MDHFLKKCEACFFVLFSNYATCGSLSEFNVWYLIHGSSCGTDYGPTVGTKLSTIMTVTALGSLSIHLFEIICMYLFY